MNALEKKMKPLDDEIQRIDVEIARLQAEKVGLMRAKFLLTGEAIQQEPKRRSRSPNVKPVILDIMSGVGAIGATSGEVASRVKERVPTVARETVGSVLSRLKFDGALVFDGERYYEAKFGPKSPSDSIRAVA